MQSPVIFFSQNFPGAFSASKEVATKTQEQLTAEAFSKPASTDCILAHLLRVSAVLHLRGANEEEGGTTAFLLTEYAPRLYDRKVLEVDLFLALENLIDEAEDGFFPTIAKILKALGGSESGTRSKRPRPTQEGEERFR